MILCIRHYVRRVFKSQHPKFLRNYPMSNSEKQSLPRALIVTVQLETISDIEFESSLADLGDLAETLGQEVVGQIT